MMVQMTIREETAEGHDRGTISDADLFRRASHRVVTELRRRAPDMTWSVSRVVGDQQVHLHVAGDLVTTGMTVDWKDTLCRVMTEGGAHIVPDTRQDADYVDNSASSLVRGYAGMPILDSDGETFGVLSGFRREPLPQDLPVDEGLLTLLCGLLGDVLQTSRLAGQSAVAELRARAVAETDHLTELPNRRGWDQALRHIEAAVWTYGDAVTVVVIDLDELKAYNDRDGHAAGDDLLRSAAGSLRSVVRKDDLVARIGGDEFGVLFSGLSDAEATRRVAQLRQHLEAAGIAASMGASRAETVHQLATFVDLADRRMYVDKEQRRTVRDVAS